jgi:4-hydroxy-2-oxoheptanedioate aldolase
LFEDQLVRRARGGKRRSERTGQRVTVLRTVPNTLKDIENRIRAAKMSGVDVIVRVSRGSCRDLSYHPLEMDAAGIMVPRVTSAADARDIVW